MYLLLPSSQLGFTSYNVTVWCSKKLNVNKVVSMVIITTVLLTVHMEMHNIKLIKHHWFCNILIILHQEMFFKWKWGVLLEFVVVATEHRILCVSAVLTLWMHFRDVRMVSVISLAYTCLLMLSKFYFILKCSMHCERMQYASWTYDAKWRRIVSIAFLLYCHFMKRNSTS